VIVGSILLAFGIDAWWDGRANEERRRALLEGLSSDFAGAEVELLRVIDAHNRQLSSSTRLLQLADSIVSPDLAPIVDSLLVGLFSTVTFDPPMGTLQALMAGGELEVLDHPQLVSQLTTWEARVGEIVQDQRVLITHINSALLPYLRDNMVRTNDLVVSNSVPWRTDRTTSYELLTDSRFESIVGDIWFGAESLAGTCRDAFDSLTRIRALIREARDSGH